MPERNQPKSIDGDVLSALSKANPGLQRQWDRIQRLIDKYKKPAITQEIANSVLSIAEHKGFQTLFRLVDEELDSQGLIPNLKIEEYKEIQRSRRNLRNLRTLMETSLKAGLVSTRDIQTHLIQRGAKVSAKERR